MSRVDKDLTDIVTEHVWFNPNINVSVVERESDFIAKVEKLIYYKKVEMLLVGILIGMLTGFIIAGIMFAIGRF